ncbi:Na(+)/citrate cotransporter isoform X1 [Patella vulgata]|uniref:Na(+)/citrate cotransporter isoform X1 n=1 Tax=Patella vulgata TaxID=6465 RepID=UPI0024A8F20A|nr:Na(+)/citrate cotransporter isoform X1 [Patella vulgata]
MSSVLRQIWSIRVMLIMFLTPLILLPLPLYIGTQEAKAAFVLIMMAVYWITEAVPIAVTALLPAFMFPMLGVVKAKDIAPAYISDTIMVFMGGLIMAVAIETWNIHRRMALRVLLLFGSEPRWLMLGLMVSTWFLSMWISNSATTAMMIPIAEAILIQLKGTSEALKEQSDHIEEGNQGSDEKKTRPSDKGTENINSGDNDGDDGDIQHKKICKAISLCICYAANSGGIASLTGTGPNLVVRDQAETVFAQYNEQSPISFTSWMSFGFALSFILMITCWGWLQIIYLRCRTACSCCSVDPLRKSNGERVKQVIREQYEALGPVTYAQGSVMLLFGLLVIFWISRDLGGIGGWGDLFRDDYVKDSTPALLLVLLLFFLPSKAPKVFCMADKYNDKVGTPRPLLIWNDVHEKLPWALFLLLGGGFALAKGCKDSGLSLWIGEQLEVFKGLNPYVMLIILCYLTAALTEVTSNVAIATIIMPILSTLAINTGVNPLFYMIPAAISASFAFMLPVATAPNALAFSYGHLKITDMVSAGFVLNIVAVPLLVMATYLWGNAVFNLDVLPPGFKMNVTQNADVTTI